MTILYFVLIEITVLKLWFYFCFQCVVIGLQSTGEARTLEQLEEMGGELNDFVSTAKYVLNSSVIMWGIMTVLRVKFTFIINM